MKSKVLEYITASLVIFNGVICILYGEQLLKLLPILCGSILLIKGAIRCIEGIMDKDYASLEKTKMEKSFILIAIGIGVLIKRSDALFIIGMFWGLNGLVKASGYLNIALYNLYHREKWLLISVKAVAEFGLSLLLVFDPFGKIQHHIFILGLELILDGVIDLHTYYQASRIPQASE